ncbi:hypothetical protein SLH46_11415 [Draconibacterium sp. IB214405]|uniref:hypothetical protein n=1 Tax=Draconibacterium sp. IB214405 TaxID=3097352 RepID=UPI002A139E02|nr:hypothetical protein [Draconibacterium sp. IB214405]MDX8339796.1 hypothetical protein [Draconibacterium sp. IB214405]
MNDTTITEIVETIRYFDSSGTSTYKRTHYYNSKGFITKMVGLDAEGKLSTRMSYDYDVLDNLIEIKDEKWNHSLGYSLITTRFNFESRDLKEIVTIGNNGSTASRSIVNTENGYPIKITSYDCDNSLIGYEIAEYNYDKNEVLIKVFNGQGSIIGKTIDLKLNLNDDDNFKEEGVTKNNFGDIIQELKPECLSCDDMLVHKYEYKYDDHNNWVSKSSYRVINGKTEKVLKIRRKIKYAT